MKSPADGRDRNQVTSWSAGLSTFVSETRRDLEISTAQTNWTLAIVQDGSHFLGHVSPLLAALPGTIFTVLTAFPSQVYGRLVSVGTNEPQIPSCGAFPLSRYRNLDWLKCCFSNIVK